MGWYDYALITLSVIALVWLLKEPKNKPRNLSDIKKDKENDRN